MPSSLARGSSRLWCALGAGDAGVNAIDGDAVATELLRQGAGQVHQRSISGAAAQVPGRTGIGAADVDDASPSRRLHVRDGGAAAPQGAYIFDVEVVQEVVVYHGLDGSNGGRRAAGRGATVDQNMQAAELIGSLVRHAVDLLAARHIRRHAPRPAGRFRPPVPAAVAVQFLPAPRHDGHVHRLRGPVPGQWPCRCRGCRRSQSPSCLAIRNPWVTFPPRIILVWCLPSSIR